MSGVGNFNEKRAVHALKVHINCDQPTLEETEDLSPADMATLVRAKSSQLAAKGSRKKLKFAA